MLVGKKKASKTMSRLIDFENFQPTNQTSEKRNYRELVENSKTDARGFIQVGDDVIKETVEMLLKLYPGKINYTQHEASRALSMSYQFVNRKCKMCQIKTIGYGGKKLITIYEIARIINYGVDNVN